jgi:hypothetical protein
MHKVPVKDQELHALRTLLLSVKGPTSYEHLRTVDVQRTLEDGTQITERKVCDTLFEAALLRGLLASDDEWDRCLRCAEHDEMPSALRTLFASILIHCNPLHPDKLWQTHKKYFWDDRTYDDNQEEFDFRAYHSIQAIAQKFNSNLTLANNFRIPVPLGHYQDQPEPQHRARTAAAAAAMLESLTPTQREHYDKIMSCVVSNEGKCFFLDGPGGSGKSYLYQTLTNNIKTQNKSVLCVASTGIAAILIDGMTAHKQFGIPVPCHDNSTSHIRLNSKEATEIRNASLLIWDESTMAHKDMLHCLDRFLCDLMNSDAAFGGKCLLLGGDFRQCLPVVPHGTSAQQASACLKASRLWHHFEQLSLTDNIRAAGDADFAPWLLRVGNGTDGSSVDLNHHNIDLIYTQQELIDKTFGTVINGVTLQHLRKTVILAPTNRTTLELNDIVLDKIPEESFHRFSIDTPLENDEYRDMIPPEFFHELHPPGMPPHDLHLKEHGVYMLLRNMNIKLGLCNGSRFVLLDCTNPFVLTCQLIPHKPLAPGEEPTIFFLPRINTTPSEQYPFRFVRKQFPIMPAFAMTINKSQGGTFDKVGIDLSSPVFSHGQLYVALSRVRSFASLKILLPFGAKSTYNNVYTEILNGTHVDVADEPYPQQHNPDGHYYHEDDLQPDPANENNDPIQANEDPPLLEQSDIESNQQNEEESDHSDEQNQVPYDPLPPPAPPGSIQLIEVDPWPVIDSLPPEQRMALHAEAMATLSQQQTRPVSPQPTAQPQHPPPAPSRRNPQRTNRNPNY